MAPWIWAVLLLVLGIALAIMEVFFTSAGLLAVLAATALAASIWMGFQQGPLAGIVFALGGPAGTLAALILAFKFLPRTAMGRRLLLGAPRSEDVLPDDSEKQRLKDLIGRTGRAKTKMLLSGVVLIDGRPVEAVSESMPVEVGQLVQVVQVRGHRVVVRSVDHEPTAPPTDPLQQTYDDPFELPQP
jgi:membrane-bound ClpP family serine protease